MTHAPGHPTPDALRRLAEGRGSAETSHHADGCPSCRADVALLRDLAAQRDATASDPCPDASTLVALQRSELPGDHASNVLAHAGRCPSCAVALDVLAADTGAAMLPAEASLVARVSSTMSEILASLATFEMPLALALDVRGDGSRSMLDEPLRAAREGRLDDAAAGFRRAIEQGEDDPAARFHLGACLVALGEPEEGATCLGAAARSRRKFAEYAWCHAQALLLAGRGDEALAELERCSRLPGPRAEAAKALAARVAAALGGR